MKDLRNTYMSCSCVTRFNPSLVAIQLFDTREGEYFDVFLTELTEEDIAGIKSGTLEIVENEDMYDRFVYWLTVDESEHDAIVD